MKPDSFRCGFHFSYISSMKTYWEWVTVTDHFRTLITCGFIVLIENVEQSALNLSCNRVLNYSYQCNPMDKTREYIAVNTAKRPQLLLTAKAERFIRKCVTLSWIYFNRVRSVPIDFSDEINFKMNVIVTGLLKLKHLRLHKTTVVFLS